MPRTLSDLITGGNSGGVPSDGLPTFSPEQIAAARQGHGAPASNDGLPSFTPEQIKAAQAAPSAETSALRGFAGGAVANFDDEIIGGLGAAGRVAGYKNLGSWKPFDPNSHLETTDKPLSAAEIVEAYRQNRDAIRADQHLDMATNPKSTIVGNIAGAVASPASKIKAAQSIGPLTKAGQLGQAVKTAALQGAVFGAGASDSDLTQGETGKFAADTALGAGLGAVIPPSIEGAKGAVKAGANAIGFTGRKMFSSLFGVTEDNASKYLARRSAINAAPELPEIKSQVDDAVAKLGKDVDSGKMNVDQAKAALSDLKTQVRNNLTDAKVDAREALRRTDDLFTSAAAKVIQPLKDKSAPTALAGSVVDAVSDLKSQVQSKSAAAQEVLGKANAKVDLAPVYSHIDETLEKLKSYGTSDADAISAKLQDYKSKLMKENWSGMDGLAAKRRLQGLDQITEYSPTAGAFDKANNAAFKGVRSALDKALKDQVPEYAEAMKPVAKDASLLSEVSDSFGDERKAIGRLGQIASPKGALDRETLAQLEQATGRVGDFTGPIDEHIRAQTLLKDPAAIDAMKRALPEFGAYRQAMAKLAKMNPTWGREQLENALASSKEGRALALAEDAYSKAQAKFEPVSSLSQASTESKLGSFLKPKGAPIETERALKSLEDQTGKKYIQPLKDRAVLDSFSKGHAIGSRNTVLGAVTGYAFGDVAGAAIGGQVGGLMDKFGPKVGKTILDGIGKLRESPTAATIRSLGLPQDVQAELEREFKIYAIQRGTQASQAAGRVADADSKVDRKPSDLKGEARWAADGAGKLQSHDKAGTLSADDLQALQKTKAGKSLLIQASDLKPGTPAMQKVYLQAQKMLKGAK